MDFSSICLSRQFLEPCEPLAPGASCGKESRSSAADRDERLLLVLKSLQTSFTYYPFQ